MIVRNKFYLIVSIIGAIVFSGKTILTSQTLRLQEAVKIGLEQNLSLTIQESNVQISKTNTGNGAAGMLPSVTAQGDVNYSLNSANQVYLDGRENSIVNGSNFQLNGGVGMDWTVFDGMAMYARRDQLNDQYLLSDMELKRQAFQLTAEISRIYQEMVYQKRIISILDENVEYLEDLMELASNRLSIGVATKLDVLQANTDLNEMVNRKELAEMQYEILVAAMNNELNRDPDTGIEVDTLFLEDPGISDLSDVIGEATENNYDIKLSEQQLKVLNHNIKLAEAQRLPTIDVNAGINVGYLNSTTGFLISNTSYGPYVGLTARYNIFDGHRVKRELEIAQLESEQSKDNLELVKQNISTDLYKIFQNHQFYDTQIRREEENLGLVEENFDIANELYRSGEITQFELRQIRIQKLSIEQRLLEARFQKTISYIDLMEASGQAWL